MEKLAEKNWYVVNTYSGREKRVQENLWIIKSRHFFIGILLLF